jgi:hypothetical protein
MSREVLAWDIDDVLLAHADKWCNWSNWLFGTELSVKDYDEKWHKNWNITPEIAEERRKSFMTPAVMGCMEPVAGMPEAMAIIKESGRFENICVTKRRQPVADMTSESIQEHYPGVFSDIVHATIIDNDGKPVTRKKVDICHELGATTLNDDQWESCFEVAEGGLVAVLYGDYGWNRPVVIPERVYEVRNPEELLRHYGLIA